jgi:hypothetical protein
MISRDRDNFDLNNLGLHVADHITAMLAYWDKNLICRFAKAKKEYIPNWL